MIKSAMGKLEIVLQVDLGLVTHLHIIITNYSHHAVSGDKKGLHLIIYIDKTHNTLNKNNEIFTSDHETGFWLEGSSN